MAAITDEQVETVRALVAAVPSGKVVTYGDIASDEVSSFEEDLKVPLRCSPCARS